MFHFGHKETVRERQQQQSRHLIEPGHFGRQRVTLVTKVKLNTSDGELAVVTSRQ